MNQPIRRKDRALSEEEAYSVLKHCEVCRLAFSDQPAPYLVPMNFGIAEEAGETVLYFHCAPEGRKLTLLRQNPVVCFEADRPLSLIRGEQACSWGMAFESVIGEGSLERLEDPAAKCRGLTALMRHYSEEAEFTFPDAMVEHTAVLRLRIHSISGKRRPLPEKG